jgi:hypothetical protein
MKRAWLLFVCLAVPVSVFAADKPFDRDGVVKLIGYDPEQASGDQCETRASTARVVSLALTKEAPAETKVGTYLNVAGMVGMARAACPADSAPAPLAPFVKAGDKLAPPVCLAAAAVAQDKITAHISEIMGTEPPDLVAGYAEGVAAALEPIREACYGAQSSWAKVATQALLIKTRADNIRASRSCTLWRLAVSKELKAAEDIGKSKGKSAGLKHLNERAGAALFGAKHYCGEDTADGLVDANFSLTKMLLDSMPDK